MCMRLNCFFLFVFSDVLRYVHTFWGWGIFTVFNLTGWDTELDLFYILNCGYRSILIFYDFRWINVIWRVDETLRDGKKLLLTQTRCKAKGAIGVSDTLPYEHFWQHPKFKLIDSNTGINSKLTVSLMILVWVLVNFSKESLNYWKSIQK